MPKGQTVTALALPSHNAEVKISGTVINEGRLVLDSPAGGGTPALEGKGLAPQLENDGLVIAQSPSGQSERLEVALANRSLGTVEVQSGELRQDENTTTINEGAFRVEAGAIFAATTGNDLIVNKSALVSHGSVALTNGASWTQEAGSTDEGSPVVMHSGTLTDVSGEGDFTLVDATNLVGKISAGQTVTAEAEPGHNSTIQIAGTVTNEGTLVLSSPPKGGESTLRATTGVSKLDNDGAFSARSESSNPNFLEIPLTDATKGTVTAAAGELRQDENTTTTNEGSFHVEAGAIFAATSGNDLLVNKGALSNGGSVALTNGASWTQEAGTAKETGGPVVMHAGTLTDASGDASFDLVDATSLIGTIPAGQTVTADAEPGHNSTIDIAGTVTNEGTLALSSPPSGGEATLAGTSSQLDNDGVLSARSESSNANFLETPLTNAAGGTVDVAARELRQDDNTKTINEGTFHVEAGASFAATSGNDLFVNKGTLSNGGSVALTNGASWTQEAATAKETGDPIVMHAGELTDVSGEGSFDLVDTTSLNGTVPKGQTVTADAEPSHNSIIDIDGTVTQRRHAGAFLTAERR